MSGTVILGAGQAGLQLAASLRELGYGGDIALVGDEMFAPYQRPPLSKAYLSGTASEAMLFMQEPAFFTEHRITFRAGDAATAVDRERRQVVLASGKVLTYDHLVFATGTRNRALSCSGEAMAGVLSLRTLDDARALATEIARAKQIVIVGAGFLGLEAATIAAAAGCKVRVVEAGSRALGRVVSAPVSAAVQRAHEALGVRFDFSETVVAIHGDPARVVAVELHSGEHIAADLVLVSIGVLPNSELAAATGLAVRDGIVVDRRLSTEDPAISAIGDCAAFPFAGDEGRVVRIESVQNAVDQARCLADRIIGKPAEYDQVPTFWSDQAGLRLQIAGLTVGGEDIAVRGDPTSGAFSAFCYRRGRLVAVESVSRLPDHMQARKLLRAKLSPTPDQASDPSFDLKSLWAVAA